MRILRVEFEMDAGSLSDHMEKLKTIQVYSRTSSGTLARYTLLEAIEEMGFWVLHTDFINSDHDIDTSKFEKLTIERLFDVDLKEIEWRETISLAIEAHDREFDDWVP